MHVVVLGAGLAGLAAADELGRRGHRVTVLEREPAVGGLASSFAVGPFHLDHGPHRFHTRSRELLAHVDELLGGELVERERRSRIHLRGRYFDYPLRAGNVLRNLPPTLLARAGIDYAVARARARLGAYDERTFEGWVTARFGRTLYDLFFGTYTRKAWRTDPARISADWASQRIGQRSLADAIRRTLFPPRDGEVRGLASTFRYPREGGIGAIARAYAARVRAHGGEIVTGADVERVEVEHGVARRVVVRVAGGRDVVDCDQLVSTIPITALVPAIAPRLAPDARAAAARLRHVAIVCAYVAVDRPSVSADHWIYLPEPHLAVHRVSEFKNFSDAVAPGDRTALCCEITCRPDEPTWRMDRETAGRLAIRDLAAAGLVREDEARPLALRRLRHAYPVYDLEYRRHLATLRAATRRVENLVRAGRQGLFRYNNMDHSIAMGRKAARVVDGAGAPAVRAVEDVAAGAAWFG